MYLRSGLDRHVPALRTRVPCTAARTEPDGTMRPTSCTASITTFVAVRGR